MRYNFGSGRAGHELNPNRPENSEPGLSSDRLAPILKNSRPNPDRSEPGRSGSGPIDPNANPAYTELPSGRGKGYKIRALSVVPVPKTPRNGARPGTTDKISKTRIGTTEHDRTASAWARARPCTCRSCPVVPFFVRAGRAGTKVARPGQSLSER